MATIAEMPLVEREAEIAALADVTAACAAGEGRLLAIEGPAGIGKTRLVAAARDRARAGGLTVLSARGGEIEREYAYGIVRQLFEPLMVAAGEEGRARLLAGSAQLAAPLFDIGAAGEGGDDGSYAALHGLYWLTVNAAGEGPIALLVDDLHWADAPSLRFLSYLQRRLDGLPALVVTALRPAEPGSEAALLAEITNDPGTVLIRPAPLSAASAAALLRERMGGDGDDAFYAACHDATGGNPLLLRELAAALEQQGVAPAAANVGQVRELGPRAVSRAVMLRLSRLPESATVLARSVAVLGDEAQPRLAADLAGLDDRTASEAAAGLVAVDVLMSGQPLRFVHPVVRASVEAEIPPPHLEAAHRRAAQLLGEAGASPERIAAHLLKLPPQRDGATLETLRAAADRALARGTPDIAVSYLRRAVEELPAGEPGHPELLHELGRAESLVDGYAASEHLAAALPLLADPVEQAVCRMGLGRTLLFTGRSIAAGALMLEAAEAPGIPEELRRLYEAAFMFTAGSELTMAEEFDRRRDAIVGRTEDDLPTQIALGPITYHGARTLTLTRDEAVALARRALAGGHLTPSATFGAWIYPVIVLSAAGETDALTTCEAALADAHLHGSGFAAAAALCWQGWVRMQRGEVQEATADLRASLEAVLPWGLTLGLPYVSGFLARTLIEHGQVEEAEGVLDRSEQLFPPPANGHGQWFRFARGRVLLAAGRTEQGIAELLRIGELSGWMGDRNPGVLPWRSEAALGLLAAGRNAEAGELAAAELADARTWSAVRPLARSLRVAALCRGGDDGIELLGEAAEMLDGSPFRFELARVLVELGAALRRSNRRADSREPLRRALELAAICGADPIAARARDELAATGSRPRNVMLSGVESLTASERRVADLAAGGRTNRDIAQALYVTPKTVEVHLSSTYRKLGIGGRDQLAGVLATA